MGLDYMGSPDKYSKLKKVGHAKAKGIIGFAALITAMVIVWINCYHLVTDEVMKTAVQNMQELSLHDEQSIATSLDEQWDTLKGIAYSLKINQFDSEDALVLGLNSFEDLMDCIQITLITDDGYSVSSSMVRKYDESLLDSCVSANGSFIRHMKNEESNADGVGEILLCGTEIEPFSVQGQTYTYIVCQMYVDALQDLLKIDCYDGRGYSSIIDTDGNYIVSVERDFTAQKIDNFFEELADGTLPKEYSLEIIHQLIESQQGFTLEYTSAVGEELVVVFSPFPEIDWFFVTTVPRDVFEEQGKYLVLLFVTIFTILYVGILVSVAIMIRRRSRQYRLEVEHRKQLADALAAEESASRAKTNFLNNMSHDIRTPMNAIVGFTALATACIDDKERVADYLRKIESSSSHLLSLINDILDMSRIESGKMDLDVKPENLAEICRDLRDILHVSICSKQIEFSIDMVAVTDEEIYCDRLKLNQILLNILSNAMKFTDAGGAISVRITESESTRAGYGTYEFRVKDTGIGMSEEFLKTIFEPFTRARSSTVSGIQGTGLGMAITKKIVDLMGGTITVQSEEGKGTEFVVTIDFRLQDEQQRYEPMEQFQGLRGLVVDNHVDTCQSVSAMLNQIGLRAEWTVSGSEAVTRSKEAAQAGDPYRVFIIDWQMPDMDGIETTRRICQIAGYDAPIILLSAYDCTDIEEEARTVGVTDFVNKPLFQSDLRNALQRVYGGQSKQTEEQPDSYSQFNGERLLLVEDVELNRILAMTVLEMAGFELDCAENGQEAVDKVANSAPGYYQAILMDIQMPVMNGYDATRRIRRLSDPALASIPIISMTADAFEEDKKKAFDAGMNAHVSKPIDIPELLHTLKRVLENKN